MTPWYLLTAIGFLAIYFLAWVAVMYGCSKALRGG